MSKRKVTSTVIGKAWLGEYLDGSGDDGGVRQEWLQFLGKKWNESPDQIAQDDLVKKWGEYLWDNAEPTNVDGGIDLFAFNGKPLQTSYKFPDPKDPGTYRMVSAKHAILGQVYEDCVLKSRNAVKQGAAADRAWLTFEAMKKRAGGDMKTHISDLAD